jgi:hypothetical protein
VERPGGVVESIACDPVSGYGVRFSQSSDFWAAYSPGAVWQYSSDEPMPDGSTHVWPDGAWLGYVVTGSGTMVEVAAPTRDEARSVLGSFEQVTVADANGCPPQLVGEPSPVAEGSLRLCRYASDGWLEQSETLSGEDALKAAGALTAAPTRSPTGCPESANPGGVRLSSADLSGIVRTEGTEGCPGVFGWGGEERDLTRDVLYWVLSPGWSGQIPGGIRMDELRR